jgi:hypothetical protein
VESLGLTVRVVGRAREKREKREKSLAWRELVHWYGCKISE